MFVLGARPSLRNFVDQPFHQSRAIAVDMHDAVKAAIEPIRQSDGRKHRHGSDRRQIAAEGGTQAMQVESPGHKSREAELIKLADKTSNLRAISCSPASDWSVERRLEYVAARVGGVSRG